MAVKRSVKKIERDYQDFYDQEILPALKAWRQEKALVLAKMLYEAKVQKRPKSEIRCIQRQLKRAIDEY